MGSGFRWSAWLLGMALVVLALAPDTRAAPVVRGAQMPGPLPTPQFRRYETTDGLPSGAIYAVAQDHNGLMWFGSAGGLVRFDGVSFKVFRHATDDPNSLPANPTYSLLIDRDNRVWTGGISTGLITYDQKSGRFRQWTHDDKQAASLASDEVWGMAQTADGGLWVATESGLDRMRPDGSGFDHVPLDVGGKRSASFGQTRALFAGADGRLWIGAESGLYLREPDGATHQVPVDPSFRGDLSKTWRIDGGYGEIRVSLTGGLLIIGADGVARPLASRQLSSQRIMSSTRDASGRLWIGTVDGVLLGRADMGLADVDQGDGQLQRIAGQPLLSGGLPGNKTWQTALDGEGGLWITFEQSSIAYLPPGWSGFSRFTHIPDDPGSLTGIAASTILMGRDGKLWLGGNDGWIDKLDAATGRVQHVVQGVQGQVVSLAEDSRGRLWIDNPPQLNLFDQGRLDQSRLEQGLLNRGKLTSIDLGHARVTRPVLLCAGDDGRIYIASWNEGVFVVDPDSLAIAPVAMEQGSDGILRPDQLTFHAGGLWYASEGGLLHRDDKDGKLLFVQGVPRQEIVAFAFDATGFWLATNGSVLEHYRYADGRAVRDDSIDLSHEQLKSDLRDLRVDSQGRLWVFANPGLWQFDQHTRRFKSFGPAHGLSNANFDGAATAMAPSGMMFATSSGGVVAFQPERLLQTEKAGSLPALSLAYLSVQRAGEVRAIALDSKVVQLGWRDRDLRVGVRLASFINPAVNRYRFRLNGFDSGWVDAGNRGERDFAGLAAGDYALEVQASGADDRWVGLATPISIHVQAPPWVRWWAWIIYAAMLAAVVGLILRHWRRRLAQRHHMQMVEQQRQMAEAASAAKTQFLATLSHEIRTPMTGVMGMAELLLSTPLSPLQHDYTQAMQRSGGMLLKLLNDALDLARIEAGKLELEPALFDPRQLLDDVTQLEQGLAHAKGIHFVLDVADDLPRHLLGDALRIKQVLLNLANNALKFTEHGHVTLRAQRTPDGLLFSVSDTGPGIPEASQARLFERFEQADGPQRRAGSGLGLAICRELVDMMGGSIELESRLAHGSTFRVRLPLAEPATVAPSSSTDAATDRRYRLLLVEDDTIVAAVIRGLLEREDHRVVHVTNGLAALAELAQASFEAVLLDLDLPGVDGFQIARLIRQREQAGTHLPIIAVTARSGSEDETRARAAGMDDFLRKPLSGEQLSGALARLQPAASSPVTDPV
jgi:signal transduction histidine kinase/ligand-binding sensor domain-containing protein/ActR/RegA family two-component response regulator